MGSYFTRQSPVSAPIQMLQEMIHSVTLLCRLVWTEIHITVNSRGFYLVNVRSCILPVHPYHMTYVICQRERKTKNKNEVKDPLVHILSSISVSRLRFIPAWIILHECSSDEKSHSFKCSMNLKFSITWFSGFLFDRWSSPYLQQSMFIRDVSQHKCAAMEHWWQGHPVARSLQSNSEVKQTGSPQHSTKCVYCNL